VRPAREYLWAVYDRYNGNLFMIAADHDSIFTSQRDARRWIRENNLQQCVNIVRYSFDCFLRRKK